jgi:hypothetical protein
MQSHGSRACIQLDVLDADIDQFGHARPRVVQQREHDLIALASPPQCVGRSQHGLHFLCGQEPEQGFLEALYRNREDLLGESQCLRILQTDITVEGVDGSQSRVAASDAIATCCFKMIEEARNEHWVEIFQRKHSGWLM